jgi:hypothetical protein
MMRRAGASMITLLWVAIGLVVALNHGYDTIENLSDLLSLVLAVLLWPAVLLDYSLHVTLTT